MDNAFDKDVFSTAPAPTWGEQSKESSKRTLFDVIDGYSKDKESVGSKVGEQVLDMIAGVFQRLYKRFVEFAKQAAEIAVSKFLVELCAMIIAALSSMLFKKYGKGVDISTNGVYYNHNGQPSPAPNSNQSGQQSMWGNSSYDGGWSRPGQSAW